MEYASGLSKTLKFAKMERFMRKLISTLSVAILVSMLLPVSTVLAEGCLLSAMNTIAGLGTQLTRKGCEANTSFVVAIHSPNEHVSSQAVTTDDSGNATVMIPASATSIAGIYRVQIGQSTADFTVSPDKVDASTSTLMTSATSIPIGGTVTVTALLRDRYENPIAQKSVIALISNRPDDVIRADAGQSDGNGRMSWTVETTTPGPMTLTAYDVLSAKALATRLTVAVGGYSSPLRASLNGFEQGGQLPVDHFRILLSADPSSTQNQNLPPQVKANELFTMIVVAEDVSGNVVEDYVKTIGLKSSDPQAEFPKQGSDLSNPSTGFVDFRNFDVGKRLIPLGSLLRASGRQTIDVFERDNPSIRGSLEVEVLRGSVNGGGTIQVLSPKDRSHIGGGTVLLQGKAPSLINLKIRGGLDTITGESDAEGVFRIQVPLHPDNKEVTLFVSSEQGQYETGVHYIVDLEAPVIGTVNVDPEVGSTEDAATITLHSEPKLPTVSVTIDKESLPMTETSSGVYVVHFTPKEERGYELTFQATDEVGNTATPLRFQWSALKKKPGKVLAVTAQGKPDGVYVEWQPPQGKTPIAEYKIYIATEQEPDNILHGVTTGKPVTSALLKDLEAGTVYQFTITAISAEGAESEERSDPVTAGSQGMKFTATPGNGKIFLEWTAPAGLPLAFYKLRFGTSPTELTEQRTLNPALAQYDVGDLLNNVTYKFELTAVDVTGKRRDDLSVSVYGTPSGEAGFHPSASDPVPPNTLDDRTPPLPDYHKTADSGLPMTMIWTTLGLALLLGLCWRHYNKQRKLAHEFLRMMEGRYRSM